MEKTVLIIDDEPGYHALFKFLLEPLGFKVLSAHDGLTGWKLISQGGIPLVFLDMHMPEMTGTEVLRRIRQEKLEQKVVILSSNCGPAGMPPDNNAPVPSVVDRLDKPFNAQQILDIIKRIFAAEQGE